MKVELIEEGTVVKITPENDEDSLQLVNNFGFVVSYRLHKDKYYLKGPAEDTEIHRLGVLDEAMYIPVARSPSDYDDRYED